LRIYVPLFFFLPRLGAETSLSSNSIRPRRKVLGTIWNNPDTILGNCLQGNVIALERFYSSLRKNENEYMTFLMLGATRWEAVHSYFREAVKAAINPTIASMATMGLVSLPGMMTGQILGGSEPWLAVKYQIAIMICIFTSTMIASIINLKLSLNIALNTFAVLKNEVIEKP
jgi:putative ABC transport system permease protein